VVDDDPMVRVMVQLGLERNGFDVWTASDGTEAIRLYRTHREHIAVVLLDVRMPGLDGLQTLDLLHQLNPDLAACFISGDMGGSDLGQLRPRGAAHFIAKPFHLDELTNVLRLLTPGVSGDSLPPGGTCED
jgi:CheY-like chemotaxis protein